MIEFYYDFMKYQPSKIEKKWQKYWADNNIFKVEEKSDQDKFYGLVEFPYPSGDGLHTGHLRSYTAIDIICRKKRMQGFNTLFPMGMDAFGLPAENYAIKTNTHPQITTRKNIDNFIRQLKNTGFSFDWSRFVETTDPKYYKWTQWIFIQMFKKGLAYKASENINWCTDCKIGLANEEVIGGVCERCGGPVVKKQKEQWLLKITDYADRLIEGLDKINFLATIKKQQSDWIGKSQGAEVDFTIKDSQEKIKVFTTRPDTLFGATFMVTAPEHTIIYSLEKTIKNISDVREYIKAASLKSDIERASESKEKTGLVLEGIKAINPVTGEVIPVFVADYVMMSYGTGAIMAVPAHDERDFEFAKKYNIAIREVIEPLVTKEYGPDAFRLDEEIVERNAVVCIIKHHQEDKYLCLDWKQIPVSTFVTGGIEDGEDLIEAAKREIAEETGYTNARFIKKLGGLVHGQFYQAIKHENRQAHFQGLYFELIDDKNIGIAEKEQAIHEIKWINKKAVRQFLNILEMQIIWDRLNGEQAYSGEGFMINSGEYNGLLSSECKKKITRWLEKNKLGQNQVHYKLHDWIFSRQRYWGEPIPMIHCKKCGWQPVNEKDLPVQLPPIDDFKPGDDGESPLARVKDWINTTCPKCGQAAERETDVMPNWAGSNWYFIRYLDPKNDQQLVDRQKADYWLPVDWYNGGMEHTTLHLLYSRFVYKFLADIGVVPSHSSIGDEPYAKRTAQGMILGEGGIKMSKSKGNVINPDNYLEKYGADTVRVYEMFMGPFDQAISWDDKGVTGVYRFLNKVWDLQDKVTDTRPDQETNSLLHKSIKKVGEDIDNMRFNTAISQMMILTNALDKKEEIAKSLFRDFVLILAPFAPHLAEEMWQNLGHQASLATHQWPQYDQTLAQDDKITIGIQINGKIRDEIELDFNAEVSESLKKEILSRDKVLRSVGDKELIKFIYVKNKIISIVTKN
ncbi:MAG: leucine--tRNA ligase [Candidatus Komeilibacteria bacterium RIFOXYC1_FULL_37_11]|uniref:Leucine--tRNA ligase n=1 Tax=Candidatus Komeilibacteria bacterium RIFOXYC1_FULL_37_11 TaxID=1798555 RepID=A0A1G2BZY5_9BACT|nr:MAG: leucine--tRNA ligase [Candidatus Komeilibacteria bacterium RIFOXYC1_FULL_37_11]OGY95727.1 MAG: leucine--tRNA ligase [Candidatus Komeilibacteria bacterium RIFOXYD1_FULL_37_29]